MLHSGIVVDVGREAITLLNEEMLFVQIQKLDTAVIGDEISYSDSDLWVKKSPRYLKVGIISVTTLLIVSALIWWMVYSAKNSVYAVVHLDINPSIELQLNRDYEVLEVFAYNEEAKSYVNSGELKKLSLQEALQIIIDDIHLSPSVDEVSIMVYYSFARPHFDGTKEPLRKELKEFLQTNGFIEEHIRLTEEPAKVQKKAKEMGLTMGRYEGYQVYRELGFELEPSAMLSLNVEQILAEIHKNEVKLNMEKGSDPATTETGVEATITETEADPLAVKKDNEAPTVEAGTEATTSEKDIESLITEEDTESEETEETNTEETTEDNTEKTTEITTEKTTKNTTEERTTEKVVPTKETTNESTVKTESQSDKITAIVRFTDSNGKGVTDGALSVSIDGITYDCNVNSSGEAAYPELEPDSVVKVTAYYAGSKVTLSQNISNNNIFSFHAVSTTIQVLTPDNKPISGATVTVKGSAKTLNAGKTNQNGAVSITLLEQGSYYCIASVNGDEYDTSQIATGDTIVIYGQNE